MDPIHISAFGLVGDVRGEVLHGRREFELARSVAVLLATSYATFGEEWKGGMTMPSRTRTGKRTAFAKGQIVQDSENTITLYFGDLKPINFRRDGVGSDNFQLALRMIDKAEGSSDDSSRE